MSETTDHAVPASITSEEKVLQALSDHPGATVAQIAVAAGVGRSTAGKILAAAEQSGRSRRTPGARDGGNRTPDRWNPIVAAKTTVRLGRGALREMVSEYLLAHPGTEFSPVAIGKALGRSSGAIANALAKLTGSGVVTQTSERPVRYAAVRPDTSGKA